MNKQETNRYQEIAQEEDTRRGRGETADPTEERCPCGMRESDCPMKKLVALFASVLVASIIPDDYMILVDENYRPVGFYQVG